MEQDDALTVLLTGRGETRFSNIINRMVSAKHLDFDMICLKPKVGPNGQRFASTMLYKQALLEELLWTYREAEEIQVYEDRPKHITGFRDFFEKISRRITSGNAPVRRDNIACEVVPVAGESKTLDPVTEAAEVQRIINSHNIAMQSKTNLARPNHLQIKRTVFLTGYMINAADTEKLQDLIHLIPPTGPDTDLKYLATNILITPRPATDAILAKVGGMGAKGVWQVNGVGCYQNTIWAVRCAPIPPSASYYTEDSGPIIVLAHRRGARPADAGRITQWQTVPTAQQLVFETTVGEKAQLRVEKEVEGENEFDSLFARPPNFGVNKRKHDDGNDHRNRGPNQHDGRNTRHRGGARDRGGAAGGARYPQRDRRDRDSGGGRGGRGNDRGGAGRSKGRGGYKSLDDVGGSGYGGHRHDDGHRGRPPPDYDAGGYGAGAGRSGGLDGAYDDLMY
jgi:HAD domain family 1 in Swiss Army Knife RNA repair proteins